MTTAELTAAVVSLRESAIESGVVLRRLTEEMAEARALLAGNVTDLTVLRGTIKSVREDVDKLRSVLHEGNGAPAAMQRIATLEMRLTEVLRRLDERNRAETRKGASTLAIWCAIIGVAGTIGGVILTWALTR